jgi:hypothetical protein
MPLYNRFLGVSRDKKTPPYLRGCFLLEWFEPFRGDLSVVKCQSGMLIPFCGIKRFKRPCGSFKRNCRFEMECRLVV